MTAEHGALNWLRYLSAEEPLPPVNWTWPLRGAGLASLGVDGAPVAEPLPACKPDEILVRVDAVSLCSSDAKMIRLGDRYPLFYGRDLHKEPTRLGHEVALTVVQVGAARQHQFTAGSVSASSPTCSTAAGAPVLACSSPAAWPSTWRSAPTCWTATPAAMYFPSRRP